MRFDIVAEPSATLLCRVLGLIAQLDLAAPDMEVQVTASTMQLWLDLPDPGGHAGRILAEKMGRCIGVEAVTLDGAPLALMPA
ncbi:hypothetical protein HZY97_09970 [Sphingomonas sp. R-74633]|uniref:hypothetical protein n=1 Tax=Sphingomonas sp. R-74633 TaxID=2751188 RepID=UPI0015D19AAB|nr:hypothetical protein [Sphingomonas sp. R-74633]NYT41082.1 hypothetical protein [Sphingomonas sp. R-74633]